MQNAQAENLLTQGVQVLVVVPHNAKTTATIVESAHKMGVPVIAYDRLIRDSDLDYYISFDAERVGELQAEYAVKHRPKGNYVLIGGAPTDNNAVLVREGQMKILKPLVDKGDIKVVADQWAKDWQAVEALKIMENALTRNNNQVDAVVVSQRRHRRRRHPGAGRAEAERQGAGHRPGRGPGRLPAHRGRHADHDHLQADRLARREGGGDRGPAREEGGHLRSDAARSTTARRTCPASCWSRSRWTRTTWTRPWSRTAYHPREDVYKEVK